jgi:hypothetical protein
MLQQFLLYSEDALVDEFLDKSGISFCCLHSLCWDDELLLITTNFCCHVVHRLNFGLGLVGGFAPGGTLDAFDEFLVLNE